MSHPLLCTLPYKTQATAYQRSTRKSPCKKKSPRNVNCLFAAEDYSTECQRKLSATSETIEVCALLSSSDTVKSSMFEASTSSDVRSAVKLRFAVALHHISATESCDLNFQIYIPVKLPHEMFSYFSFLKFHYSGFKIVFPSFGRVTPTSKSLSRAGADFYSALGNESSQPHGFCTVLPLLSHILHE